MTVTAIYENGVLRPQEPLDLEEGALVTMTLEESANGAASNVPPELQAEFDLWERASDEAWAMIDQWEKEEQQ